MNYIELLKKQFDLLNDIPLSNRLSNEKYEVFSGIKHKKDLYNKVKPVSKFDIQSFDWFYVVEVWKGSICAFRDYLVHDHKTGLHKLEHDVAERVISMLLLTGIEAAIKTGKELRNEA